MWEGIIFEKRHLVLLNTKECMTLVKRNEYICTDFLKIAKTVWLDFKLLKGKTNRPFNFQGFFKLTFPKL